MKPLVTVLGASGFLGSAVVAALARHPIRLRAVARGPGAVPAAAVANVEVRTADLTDAGQLGDAVAGSTAVLNLVLHESGWRGADDDPATTERVNVGVMRELVESCRWSSGPAMAVVLAGSVSQMGVPFRVPIDGTEPDRPESNYDRQKLLAERVLKEATDAGIVRGTCLRLPTVFGSGPGRQVCDRGVLATMTRRALAGQPLTMWHDGTVVRDLLHVDDAAAAFVAALGHADRLSGRHWLLGTGRAEPLGDVFGTISELVAAHTGRAPVPVRPVPPPDGATSTDLRDVVVDSAAFRSRTGWRPRVRLRDGLDRMVGALNRPTIDPTGLSRTGPG